MVSFRSAVGDGHVDAAEAQYSLAGKLSGLRAWGCLAGRFTPMRWSRRRIEGFKQVSDETG